MSAAFRWRGGGSSALTPLAISSSRPPHDAMHAYMPRQRTKVSLKHVRACRARACARCGDGLPSSMNSRNPCSSIYGVNFARRGAVQVGNDSLYLGIRDGTDVSKRRPRGRGPARGVKKRTKRTKTGQRPRRPRRCMEGEGMSTSSELCQASLSSHPRHCSPISRPQWSFSNAKAEQGGSGHSTNEVLRGAERARQEKTSRHPKR